MDRVIPRSVFMPVLQLLASGPGRVIRIVAGLALIGVGLAAVQGPAGLVIALVGVLLLAAGTFDVCVLSPFFGLPFAGPRLRRALHDR